MKIKEKQNGKEIIVYDVTLRDGWQDPRKNLPIALKQRMYNVLSDLKPDYIEACWPSSSSADMNFIKQVVAKGNKYSKIAAFGSTANPRNDAKYDKNLNDIISTGAKTATIFGKTWDVHINKQLGISLLENLMLIKNSVRYLKENGLEVIYDCEHFFSGFKKHPNYAFDCIRAARSGGATTIALCDTKGACRTKDIRDVVNKIYEEFADNKDITWGIHCHNDSGFATANTLEFVDNILKYFDKVHVQGTINGLGERCGNGDLCEILPDIEDKYGYKTGIDLSNISMISKRAVDITGIIIPDNKPYVGRLAFANKGGAHIDGEKKGATYLHTDPEKWGNSAKIISGNQSGKANIMLWLEEFGIEGIDKKDVRISAMLERVKELSEQGYDLSENKAERALLMQEHLSENPGKFMNILDFSTREIGEYKGNRSVKRAETVIRGHVYHNGDQIEFEQIATSEHGPIDSQKKVLIKVMEKYYNCAREIKLADYIPKISREIGSESYMRVPIKLTDGKDIWETIGISDSIIEASLEALYKGFMYKLIKEEYK
ncbi:MAG: alpha-isopropylmalate synthase regulatory domain-containing protein [Nanoarchaeota archaeon]|nr:alpha-isopropylmalate synthase regulatory domain-containing protein [Nanoarchaeota archaeon]